MGYWSSSTRHGHGGGVGLFFIMVIWLALTLLVGGNWLDSRPVGEPQKIVNGNCNMSNFFVGQDFPCNATAQKYGWPFTHHTSYTNVTDLSNPDYKVSDYDRKAVELKFSHSNGLSLLLVSLVPLGILMFIADRRLDKKLRESERKIGL